MQLHTHGILAVPLYGTLYIVCVHMMYIVHYNSMHQYTVRPCALGHHTHMYMYHHSYSGYQ